MSRLIFVFIALMLYCCGDTSDSGVNQSIVNTESSSSSNEDAINSSFEESSSSIIKLDTLPFDTTGTAQRPMIYFYTSENREGFDEYYDFYHDKTLDDVSNIIIARPVGYYCRLHFSMYDSLENIYMQYNDADYFQYVLMHKGDSLMYSSLRYCNEQEWRKCEEEEENHAFYYEKIVVQNDTFYYSKTNSRFVLLSITDSTILQWEKIRPDYIPPPPQKECLSSYLKESDTLAKVISCDTLYIEKYNLKITDNDGTWIFENETCSFGDPRYYNDSTQCTNEYNSRARCLLKVMNTYKVPRLCRGNTSFDRTGVWCILDEEKPI